MSLTRLESIRLFCLDCCAGSRSTVRECSFKDECSLWPHRMGTGGGDKSQLIRRYCRSCIGESPANCSYEECSLWPFRTGRRTSSQTKEDVFKSHIYVMAKGHKHIGMAALLKGENEAENASMEGL